MLEGMIVAGEDTMAQSRKQGAETLYQQAFTQSLQAQALLDEQGRWLELNAALRALLGEGQAPGQALSLSLDPQPDWDELLAQLRAGAVLRQLPWNFRLADQELSTLVSLQALSGSKPLRILLSLQVLPEEGGDGIRDELTGLAGHALFMDRLQLALTRSRRNKTAVAVMMISVDDYAPRLAARGQAQADELLRQVASSLRDSVRRSDTLARLGGDVFALILEEVGTSLEAITLAAKICDSLDQVRDLQMPQGVSIGGVMAHADSTPWDLIRRADEALREAQRHPGHAYEMAF